MPKIRGKNKLETAENASIVFILVGALMLSAGIGLNIFATKGFPTILAMLGSFITFAFTIILILIWLMKEFKGE